MFRIRTSRSLQRLYIATLLTVGCLLGLPAQGQEDISVQRGEYTVYYSVFNTSFLSPENARAISVVRARDRGLVNISVARAGEPGTLPVTRVSGSYFNLVHRHTLEFREVIEPGAVYYLAQFDINSNDETIVFDIEVTADETGTSIPVKFQRQMFFNE